MLRATEVKPGVYWVGGIDWTERDFHGYTTDRGSTYNAYLILDERITLIDTCKPLFAGDLLKRIADVVDPSKIDYVVSNHVEQDHSGALPAVMAAAPNAKIVTSDPHGLRGLQAHYGADYDYVPVKNGDTLPIGRRTLSFVATSMVHWPDNMVAYSGHDRILFSNDAFGQHFASSARFDDEAGLPEVLAQAKKYYANIIMPYSRQVAKAMEAFSGFEFDMIAPSHGVVWRSHVPDILDAYAKWSSLAPDDYAVVVYDSMWHTTEAMAGRILEAFAEAGVSARLFDLKVDHISDVMTEVLSAKWVAVGSPTLNNGMMPTVAGFLCYLKGLSPKNRIGIPFGSYGWGQNGPREVANALEAAGFSLDFGILTHQWAIDEAGLESLRAQVLEGVEKTR